MNWIKLLFPRQLHHEDDLLSFTEIQDSDNEILTTTSPNMDDEEDTSTTSTNLNNLLESDTTTTSAIISTVKHRSGLVSSSSIKPILNLKPVPEIVKPVSSSTRRPHTFIRRPEIVRVQEFAKPGTFMFEMSKPSPRTHLERLQRLNTDGENNSVNSVTLGRKFVPPNSLTYGFR